MPAAPASRASRARYRRILRFAGRALVVVWWMDLVLPRVGLGRLAERTRAARTRRLVEGFRDLAVDLGGLMIKVGQFMSSRLDVLPPEITKVLEGLQDEVPAAPFASIATRAEEELGAPLDRVFETVDATPVAAASLGQAYRARLSPEDARLAGFDDVVVKVQRPGIDEIIDVDLAALRRVSRWVSRVRVVSDRVDVRTLVEEFATTSREEVDYLHEAVAAERFAADFAGDDRVGAPAVVWERTTRRLLTLEDVTAIKITDVAALRAAGIDPADVARTFAAVMFDQLFRHGFFHADPHPGNVFVTPTDAAPGWRLTFIDFGMMGEVSPTLRSGLRKLLVAVAARDGAKLVAAVQDIGVLLPTADTADLERALTQLFARFGGMGFAELRDVDPREFRDFAMEFGDVVRRLPVQLPEHFLLIIRSMSLTSGVCSALVPSFNLWEAVEPYAGELVRDEGRRVVADLASDVVATAGALWQLPTRLDRLMTEVERGRVRVDLSDLESRVGRIERLAGRALSALVFAGLLIGGVILRSADAVLGIVLMVASVLPLLHTLFGGVLARRSGPRR